MGQSKNQVTSNNSKVLEKKDPLSQRAYYQKLNIKKYHYDLNYKNFPGNYKGNKKLTSKFNTLKNSRKNN